jgi:hypothetical protein
VSAGAGVDRTVVATRRVGRADAEVVGGAILRVELGGVGDDATIAVGVEAARSELAAWSGLVAREGSAPGELCGKEAWAWLFLGGKGEKLRLPGKPLNQTAARTSTNHRLRRAKPRRKGRRDSPLDRELTGVAVARKVTVFRLGMAGTSLELGWNCYKVWQKATDKAERIN